MIDLLRERGHPVYMQIKEQLERRIASGQLQPGQMLPSVRSLSETLQINPNTVVRAYRELELLGLVESRHGEGTFVSARLLERQPAHRLLEEHAGRFVKAARELGASRQAAAAAIEKMWDMEVSDEER